MTAHTWVVDASVGAMLFLPESLSDAAHRLFDMLSAEPPGTLHVPDLFFVEVANVLLKHSRRGTYAPADLHNDLADLRSLALRATPTFELVDGAITIAQRYDISAYDSCYVALAERLDAPLITGDLKLLRKVSGSPHKVRWLGDGVV